MTTTTTLQSRQAASSLDDTYRAASTVLESIGATDADITFLFVSPRHDPEAVERAVAENASSTTLCCTTAGEIWREEGHIHNVSAR